MSTDTTDPFGSPLALVGRAAVTVSPSVADIDAWLRDERGTVARLARRATLDPTAQRDARAALARAEHVADRLESLPELVDRADLEDEVAWLQTATAALVASLAAVLAQVPVAEAA